MHPLIIFTMLLSLVSQVAMQCSTSQNANCGNWVRNGFCDNMAYSLSQRQSYCGVSCGLCTTGGAPITSGSGECTADANKNCAKWASEKEFCTKAEFASKKMMYCCKTCGPVKPVGGEGKPVGVKGRPVGGKGKPVGGKGKPVGGPVKPVGGKGKPVGGKGRPVGARGRPVGGKGKPVGGRGRPVGGKGKPVGGKGKPVGGKDRPVGGRGKPFPR